MRGVLLLLALAGCTGTGDKGDTAATCTTEYPPAELDAAWTDCASDDDCVVVELGMCDACNGGTAVAVGADSEGDVVAAHAECPPDTGDWGCTLEACAPLVATCEAGTCTLGEAATW